MMTYLSKLLNCEFQVQELFGKLDILGGLNKGFAWIGNMLMRQQMHGSEGWIGETKGELCAESFTVVVDILNEWHITDGIYTETLWPDTYRCW